MEHLPTPPGERPGEADTLLEPPCTTTAADTATATVDEHGIVTSWSEGAQRLLGYHSAEIIGHPAAQLLADDTDNNARPQTTGKQRWHGTAALRHHDGHRIEQKLLAHHRTPTSGTPHWLVVSAITSEPPTPKNPTPNNPNEPSRPGGPSRPNEASRPGEPSRPNEPSRPGEPGGPSGPSGPSGPNEPSRPGGPSRASRASGPGELTGPNEAGGPSGPNEAGGPGEQGGPGGPGGPSRASGPNEAGGPSGPGGPGGPSGPGGPGGPSGPGGPGGPSGPGGPGGPEEPGGPGGWRQWAFAQAPCILAVFDADLRLAGANTSMERAIQLTEADMHGLRLPDIAPGAVSEETERAMRQVLHNGRPQSLQAFPGRTGPGEEHNWSTTLTALTNEAGHVGAVCLTAHPKPPQPLTQQRMRLLNDTRTTSTGTTSPGTGTAPGTDIARTAQELADTAVAHLADFAAVDLLPTHGDEPPTPPPTGPVTLRRAAMRSVLEGNPESLITIGETSTYPEHSPVAQCLAHGRGARYDMTDPALTRWAHQDPQAARIRDYGTHSLMILPLHARGTTLGTALFTRHQHTQPFTPHDQQLAEELTNQAALTIHNTRRHTRQRTTTMTLQRSLLPHTLPDHAALTIASRYLPAGTEAGIGGDWFDVIPLSGARVALVVGDVAGHGIRASATMGRLRTAVRTLADVDLPPDELLTHLDDLVIHLSDDEPDTTTTTETETATGIGTTCLYAIYDPTTRHCTLARAGHPPPAVVTPTGTAYLLDIPPGPPLGLGGLPFETLDTQLPEGSLLALYTDGLLQPHDTDIDETLDKIFAALTHPAHTLDTVCDRILTTALTHRPHDDIALLLARTQALPTHRIATWNLPPDPAIVAQARHHATTQLTTWNLTHTTYTTQLIVSELVTNAIRYGQPPIQLRMIHENTTLTCEVTDTSNTTPHMRRARTYDEGGRGLLLIAQLAQRWGTRHHPTGKTIWTEQTLTP
ncbi:SpoIIE family protein phosphatase [Streptomyces sp. NPDC001514]